MWPRMDRAKRWTILSVFACGTLRLPCAGGIVHSNERAELVDVVENRLEAGHRPETLRRLKRVVVLGRGRIVSDGRRR